MTIRISKKMAKKQVITLTENAVKQVKKLLKERGKPSVGIRIGVKSGGCSGMKYVVEYADQKNPYDEVVESGDVTVLIDPKALMYLIDSEMDYVIEEFKSGFTFTNPNEKGKCGCGSSFSV
jgi:iron-sulfur cluster assembly protein